MTYEVARDELTSRLSPLRCIFGYVFNASEHYRWSFIIIGASSAFTIARLLKALPRLDATESVGVENLRSVLIGSLRPYY